MDYYKKYLKYKFKYLKLKGGYKTFDDVLNESYIIKESFGYNGIVIDNKNNEKNKYEAYDNYLKSLFKVDDLTKIKINDKVTIFSMSTGTAPMESYLCYMLKSLKDVVIDLVIIEKIELFNKYKETYDELKKIKLIDNYYSIDEYINNMKEYIDGFAVTTQLNLYEKKVNEGNKKTKFDTIINGYLDFMKIGDIIFCGTRIQYFESSDSIISSLALSLATNVIIDENVKDYFLKYKYRHMFFVFLTKIEIAIRNIKNGNIYVKLLQFESDEINKLSSLKDMQRFFPKLTEHENVAYNEIKKLSEKYVIKFKNENHDNKIINL